MAHVTAVSLVNVGASDRRTGKVMASLMAGQNQLRNVGKRKLDDREALRLSTRGLEKRDEKRDEKMSVLRGSGGCCSRTRSGGPLWLDKTGTAVVNWASVDGGEGVGARSSKKPAVASHGWTRLVPWDSAL